MSFQKFNSRFWTVNAEKEKGTRLTLSAFRSEAMDNPSLSLAVFVEGGRGPAFKESLNDNWIVALRVVWDEVLRAGKGNQKTLVINSWDRENKKSIKKGTVTLGIDEQDVPFIGITAPNLTKKFPLTPPFNPDTSSLDLPASAQHRLGVEPFLLALTKFVNASSVAGYSPASRNGNGAGGGGYNNGGGSRGSGGYGGGSSSAIESEIPF